MAAEVRGGEEADEVAIGVMQPGPAVLDGVKVTDQAGTTPGFVSMTRPRGCVATAATGRFANVTQATSSAGWR
jgi:hypothetical protein